MAKPKATQSPPQSWRNRIVGHGEEAPDQLLANPRNWRIHPQEQQQALTDVLNEVGWVQEVIVNQETGFVVDGHLRVALAISRNEAMVPVVYVSLTEQEELLVLASIDPLAGMAVAAQDSLDMLLDEVKTNSPALQALLDGMRAPAAMPDSGGRTLPEAVISYQLIFDDEEQQDRWFEFLKELKSTFEGETIAARLDAFLVKRSREAA